jgi:hypothetical protein
VLNTINLDMLRLEMLDLLVLEDSLAMILQDLIHLEGLEAVLEVLVVGESTLKISLSIFLGQPLAVADQG